jgi:hypothetical protein
MPLMSDYKRALGAFLSEGDRMDKVPSFSGGHHGAVITWYDSWRQLERTFRYQGRCVVCRRATWAADDGENDPRGILGDHASSALVGTDYGQDPGAPDVPLCFPCANDEPRYRAASAIAESRWT